MSKVAPLFERATVNTIHLHTHTFAWSTVARSIIMMISPRTGTTVLNNTYPVPGGAGFHVTMQRNGSLLIQDQGGRVTLRVARFGEAFEFDAVDAATKQRVVYREVLGAVTGTVDGVAVVGWGGLDAYFGTSIYMRIQLCKAALSLLTALSL